MKEINEIKLAITGNASLPAEPDRDKLIKVTGGELSIYSVEDKDNEDGTITRKLKANFFTPPTLEDGELKIVGKNTGKKSKHWRTEMNKIRIDRNVNMEEEEHYQKIMNMMLYDPEAVYDYVISMHTKT